MQPKMQMERVTCNKIKTLCNTLNWGNWNSGFIKLGVRWAERDICLKGISGFFQSNS